VDTEFSLHRAKDRSWMLQPADIAAMILHLLTYPAHALPSLVEMRPARPPK
jgi:NADP-dependent 3-hydroxy acid dehydrogenase YdfG